MLFTAKSIKTAYPMDSVVTELADDGLPMYDRAYNASDLRSVMRLILTDGVFPNEGDELLVSQSSSIWKVGTGVAVAGGLIIRNEEPVSVVDQAELGAGQYAFIVVAGRFDSIFRDGAIYSVTTNTPSYTPERTESRWELVLARVDWHGTMTDLRLDMAMCGVVAPVIPVDTDSFMAELKTAVSQFNLNVGTVTSLPSGTTPTVTVRKPEVAGGDVYIDFGIPRGERGEDGDKVPAIFVRPDSNPPSADAGAVWLVDDDSEVPHEIVGIRVYESEGLCPSADLYPGDDVYPGGVNQWVDHVISPLLVSEAVATATGRHFAR